MSSEWIKEIQSHGVRKTANMLGLKEKRNQSLTPCPACGATQRSKSDRRGPLGMRNDDVGWRCWACSVTGDVPDLAARVIAGKCMKELNRLEMSKVRSVLAGEGFCTTENGAPASKVKPLIRRRTEPVQQKKPQFSSPKEFAWRDNITKECEDRLWSDEGSVTLSYLMGRGFTEESLKEWHIGCLTIQKPKGIESFVAIPVFDREGEAVNMRFRSVPTECGYCGGDGCSRCKQTGEVRKIYLRCPGRPSTLFAIKNLESDHDQGVIICEGELDVIAMWQLGFKRNVVSGTAGAGTWSDDWLDALEPYRHFILAYDTDKAGDAGAKTVADKLGKDRCSRAKLPHNDAAECLSQCVGGERIAKALDEAQPLTEAGLARVDHYIDDIETLIRNPSLLKGNTTGSTQLDDALGGIRPGLWIVTGDTAAGKTSFVTWLALEQARLGIPVMLTSFEQRPVGTVQKLLRAQMGGDFSKRTESERATALGKLGNMPIFIVDHYGHLDPDELKELIGYAIRRRDVKMAIVDHLGFLIDDAEDERRAIEKVVRDYAVLAVQRGITLVLICHPNNLSVAQQRRVRLGDLKGASAIRQDAHVGLVLERILPGRAVQHPACAVHVDKCRSEFGLQGARVVMYYDPQACVYADEWAQTPMGAGGGSGGFPISI
jgi:5S rRNA maturation endonuclease (ribonuclease M5)